MMFVGKHTRLYVLSVLFLFVSFALNGLGVLTTEQFVKNFKDSEALVTSQVKCEGRLYGGQLLNTREGTPKGTCDPANYEPYSSQFGIQGRAYTLGYKILKKVVHISPSAYVALAQLLTALSSAAVLALVVLWVRSNLGKIPALTVLVLVGLSPMIVGFSRNLYWAMPLMFLPVAYVLYAFRPDRLKPGRGALVFFVGLVLLLYIKYLAGYEFLTAFTILPIALMSYSLYVNGESLKSYIKATLAVGLVSLVAFGAALTTHAVSLNPLTGSMSRSVAVIRQTAKERTTESKKYTSYAYYRLKDTANDVYQITNTYLDYDTREKGNSIILSEVVSLFNYAILPIVNVPIAFNSPFGVLLQSNALFVMILAFIFVSRRRLGLSEGRLRALRGLYLALLIGFAGFASWLLLARAHSLVHVHINGIMLYLPFALVGYMIVGIALETRLDTFRKKIGRR